VPSRRQDVGDLACAVGEIADGIPVNIAGSSLWDVRCDMSLADERLTSPHQSPRLFISALGWLTIALAAATVIIPRALPVSAVSSIGSVLIVAGVFELMIGASSAKWSTTLVLASGLLTTAAALAILLIGPHTFFTLSAIVTAWLVARSALLVILAFRAPWPAATAWLLASALGNVVLAALAVVITMSVVVMHTLFGPAPKGAGYSFIPALSLLFNGISFAAAAIAPRGTAACT